ncbi:MAG: class I SAM-dependent methyltransferase [Nitrospira sp.]|nr:class I SAM-dependent methyltransferase [Nitrospira sp.]
MKKSYAAKYHILEKYHWWFLGRRDIIYKLIKHFYRDIDILEVGCSGGLLIGFLQMRGFKNLIGIDIDHEAIELCRQTGITNVFVRDAEKTGFEDQQFDIIIASDILEHMKDEDKTLLEWHRILKPKGELLVFVPAFNFLWSKHDEVNYHYRRYSKSRLLSILQKNGFKVKRISYWNFSLFFPVTIVRLFQRLLSGNRSSGDQLYDVNIFVNRTLEYLLGLENKVLSLGINLPLGISIFARAGKT